MRHGFLFLLGLALTQVALLEADWANVRVRPAAVLRINTLASIINPASGTDATGTGFSRCAVTAEIAGQPRRDAGPTVFAPAARP